ncbi:hypothetical protein KJ765_03015 [Candidatus Micrarchaeota archaeon]|nr:hypothetical protein [Candidatus Micrarchaeota archaeon]
MKTEWLVTGLLGVLLGITLIQAVQLSALSGNLNDLTTSVQNVKISPGSTSQEAPLQVQKAASQPKTTNVQVPGNIANLPAQVGGC